MNQILVKIKIIIQHLVEVAHQMIRVMKNHQKKILVVKKVIQFYKLLKIENLVYLMKHLLLN